MKLPWFAFLLALACAQTAHADVSPDELGKATTIVLTRVSVTKDYDTLAALFHPEFRDEASIRAALARGEALGTAKGCTNVDYTPIDKWPGMISFKGDCEFERGKAFMLMVLGIPKNGDGVMLFALELRPPRDGAAAESAATAATSAGQAVLGEGHVTIRTLPPEADRLVERIESCARPARAPASAAEAGVGTPPPVESACATLDADVAAARVRWQADRVVLDALDTATRDSSGH